VRANEDREICARDSRGIGRQERIATHAHGADLDPRERIGPGLAPQSSPRAAKLSKADCFHSRENTSKLVKFYMATLVGRLDHPRVSILGENLRAARLKLGITQEEVANRSGVQMAEVSRIESGKRDPQVSTVLRLAKAVEIPPGQLLEST